MDISMNLDDKNYLLGTLECIFIFEIEYEYTTKRRNKKSRTMKVIAQEIEEAKCKFLDYIFEFNKKYSYREMANVQILAANCIDHIRLKIK